MHSTQYSLLARLQTSSQNAESWTKFINIYAPLLEEWASRLHVPVQERPDLIQETFVKLLTGIGNFKRSTGGSFRSWLFTVLRNCWLDKMRRLRPSEALGNDRQDPRTPDPQQVIEHQEYQHYVLRRVFHLIIADFPATTQVAFRRYVLNGESASEVSRDLGISINALYLVRARVLRRLKAELAGLVDDE